MNCELVRSQLIAQVLIWDPIGTHWWFSRIETVFVCSALQFSAPEHVNGLRKEQNRVFFWVIGWDGPGVSPSLAP